MTHHRAPGTGSRVSGAAEPDRHAAQHSSRAVEPHRPALAAAAIALGAALQINNGFYDPGAVRLLAVALALAWAALVAPAALRRLVPDRAGLVAGVLFAGLAAQLIAIMRAPIGMYFARPMPNDHPGFVPGLMAVAIAAGLAVVGPRAVRQGALAAIVLTHVWLGVLTYRGSPAPHIDVVTVHDAAFAAVRDGESPYSISFPDIYAGKQAFYPPGMAEGGTVNYGFPYPPLSLLMAWPGEWLGDFRYAELAALAATGLAIAAAGGWSSVSVLAAALLLFTPRAFFTLEQAWTEPLSLVWLAGGLWLWRTGRSTATAAAVGLAIATKQYVVLAGPLAWLLRRRAGDWWRQPVIAGAVAAAAMLPGVVFDPRGFFHSAVLVQVRERLRYDALSFAVTFAHATGTELPGLVYVALVAGAVALAAWRAPRTPAGFAAGLGAVLLTTFAVGKKAFCNYYFFVIAVLALAIAASGADTDRDAVPCGD